MMVRWLLLFFIFIIVGFAQASYLMPTSAKKHFETEEFTTYEYQMLDGVKNYFIGRIDKFQERLNDNYDCFLPDRLRICRQGQGYFQAKFSQLARVNRQLRLLIGVYKSWGDKGDINLPIHIISGKALKSLGVKKLRLTKSERLKVYHLVKTNKRQIFDEWKKLPVYPGSKPDIRRSPSIASQNYNIDKIQNLEEFRGHYAKKMNEIKAYYLDQIMSLIAVEPVALFIDQSVVTPYLVSQAYKKYIIALEGRIEQIEDSAERTQLQKLALLYDSIMYHSSPKTFQDFTTLDGEVFADIHQWNQMINKINNNIEKDFAKSKHVSRFFLGVGLYTTFGATTALFKLFVGLSYIFTSGVDTYFSLGDYKVNLMDWLSGFRAFDHVASSHSRYVSHFIMSLFLAQPVVSSLAKGSQLFKLELEASDTIIQNIRSYINGKTKTQAKTEVSHTDINSDFNDGDLFVETNDDNVVYITSYIADYNDYKVFKSGCLILLNVECPGY